MQEEPYVILPLFGDSTIVRGHSVKSVLCNWDLSSGGHYNTWTEDSGLNTIDYSLGHFHWAKPLNVKANLLPTDV